MQRWLIAALVVGAGCTVEPADTDAPIDTDPSIGETDTQDPDTLPGDTDDTDADETDPPADTDETDVPVDTDETDVPVDTDTADTDAETDAPVDTDTADTDETDAPVDTDTDDTDDTDDGTVIIDTDPTDTDPVETDEPVDTDPVETDEPVDTDPVETDEPVETDMPVDTDDTDFDELGCEVVFTFDAGASPSEHGWSLSGLGDGFFFEQGYPAEVLSSAGPFESSFSLPTGYYLLDLEDSFGDGWDGGGFLDIVAPGTTDTVQDISGGSTLGITLPDSGGFGAFSEQLVIAVQCDGEPLPTFEDCDGTSFALPDIFDAINDGECSDGSGGGPNLDCEAFDFSDGDCIEDTDIGIDCPPGDIIDCDGLCTPEDWLGDGECDLSFDCAAFDFDDGDCIGDTDVAGCDIGEVPDCKGDCYPEAYIGDGDCDDGTMYGWGDPDFNCAAFDFDDGDCELDTDGDFCPPGDIIDCDGLCTPEDWLGDGECDQSLNCVEFDFDDGDCDGGPIDTDAPIEGCEIEVTFVNAGFVPAEHGWGIYTSDEPPALLFGDGRPNFADLSSGTYVSTHTITTGVYRLVQFDSWGDGWDGGGNISVTGVEPGTLVAFPNGDPIDSYTWELPDPGSPTPVNQSIYISVQCDGDPPATLEDCSGAPWELPALEAIYADGTCDDGFEGGPDLDCALFDFDGGDCVLIEDCDGTEWFVPTVEDALGDGICDDGSLGGPNLDCEEYEADLGDCAPPVIVLDCDGNEFDESYLFDFLGDGTCDDDAIPGSIPNLDCAAYYNDGGDCTDALWSSIFADCAEWVVSGPWECGEPTSGPGAALVGSNVVATNLAGNYPNSQPWSTSHVTTAAPIDIPASGAYAMSFHAWYEIERSAAGTNWDGFRVEVSDDGGSSFTVATDVSPAYNGGSSSGAGFNSWAGVATSWQTKSVNLSAWAGQSILIRFGFFADGSGQRLGPYIDYVRIAEVVTDCNGDLADDSGLGNGICDPAFNCPAFPAGEADCAAVSDAADCPAGSEADCDLVCWDAGYLNNALGDDFCDDGSDPEWPNLNCPEFNEDEGDCALCGFDMILYTGDFGSENSFEIRDDAGDQVFAFGRSFTGNLVSNQEYALTVGLPSGDYTVILYDSWGDGWQTSSTQPDPRLEIYDRSDSSLIFNETIPDQARVTGGNVEPFSLTYTCSADGSAPL